MDQFNGFTKQQSELFQKTYDYVKQYIAASPYPDEKEKRYRLEHTLRVAAIGSEIARKESLDETALVLGCLLHDIGKYDSEHNRDHGRASATVARPFLQTLGIEEDVVQEIAYGIAIHVDGKADFDHPLTTLADTISDCDNIDRFAVFRIYDMLRMDEIEKLPSSEVVEKLLPRIKRLKELHESYHLATPTATGMFRANIKKQYEFLEQLERQMDLTTLFWKDMESK